MFFAGITRQDVNTKNSVSKESGFTIVEIMVASIILIISIVALLTLLRTGRSLGIEELHRRAARAVIDSCYESPALYFETFDSAAALVQSVSFRMDSLNPNLAATYHAGVGPRDSLLASAATYVSFNQCTVSVSWLETGKTARDTLSVIKRLLRP